MSVKTIRDWDARKIATAVAVKALEHVLAPKEAALAAAAKEAYDALLLAIGLTPEVRAAVTRCSERAGYGEVTVIVSKSDAQFKVILTSEDDKYEFFLPRVFIEDPAAIARLRTLHDACIPLQEQRSEMAREIAGQIANKSVSVVLKTWPEIAPFVRATMRIPDPMVSPLSPVPFQALLNKYLTALPAPAPTTPAPAKPLPRPRTRKETL